MATENISLSIATKECCWPNGEWTHNLLITSQTTIQQSHQGQPRFLKQNELVRLFYHKRKLMTKLPSVYQELFEVLCQPGFPGWSGAVLNQLHIFNLIWACTIWVCLWTTVVTGSLRVKANWYTFRAGNCQNCLSPFEMGSTLKGKNLPPLGEKNPFQKGFMQEGKQKATQNLS